MAAKRGAAPQHTPDPEPHDGPEHQQGPAPGNPGCGALRCCRGSVGAGGSSLLQQADKDLDRLRPGHGDPPLRDGKGHARHPE